MLQRANFGTLLLAVAVVTLPGGTAFAQKMVSQHIHKTVSLAPDGSLTIDNPFGRIVVTGSDLEGLDVDVIKTVHGPDDAALRQGIDLTELFIGGDVKTESLELPGWRFSASSRS
jgi:hypothetical protein